MAPFFVEEDWLLRIFLLFIFRLNSSSTRNSPMKGISGCWCSSHINTETWSVLWKPKKSRDEKNRHEEWEENTIWKLKKTSVSTSFRSISSSIEEFYPFTELFWFVTWHFFGFFTRPVPVLEETKFCMKKKKNRNDWIYLFIILLHHLYASFLSYSPQSEFKWILFQFAYH